MASAEGEMREERGKETSGAVESREVDVHEAGDGLPAGGNWDCTKGGQSGPARVRRVAASEAGQLTQR